MIRLAENIVINENAIEAIDFDRWKLTIQLPHTKAIIEVQVEYDDSRKRFICHEKGDKYYSDVVWGKIADSEKKVAYEVFPKWIDGIVAGASIDTTVRRDFNDKDLPYTVCFRVYLTH